MAESDWTFIGAFDMEEGDDEEDVLSEEDILKYEKLKYEKSVLQAITELEKQIKAGKLRDDPPTDFLDGLREEKQSQRDLRIDY